MSQKTYNAEIICVGTELLLGDIINTNAAYLSKELAALGINLYYQEVIGDNAQRLFELFSIALKRSDIIITSGGLGPTYDDITKETVARVMGLELVENASIAESLKSFFAKKGVEMTPNNLKQALVPQGAKILENDCGTAPGILIEQNGKCVIMLPGPPRELVPLFEKKVRPYIASLNASRIFVSKNINVYGKGESFIENQLKDIMESSKNPTLAPYAKDGEVLLRITSAAGTREEAEKMIQNMADSVYKRIGEYVYATDRNSLQEVLVERFSKRNLTLATAESCTGGLVSERITRISGSSKVFGCGICSYSNDIKINVLKVKKETIEKYGAVSEQCAIEMAQGVRNISGSDVAVSITGIAGPGGGTKEKPVGLVYVTAVYKDKTVCERLLLGRNDSEREYIRYLASSAALAAALKITGEFNKI